MPRKPLDADRSAQRFRQGAGDGFISPASAASQARGQAPSGGASVGGLAVPLRWPLFMALAVALFLYRQLFTAFTLHWRLLLAVAVVLLWGFGPPAPLGRR